MNPITPIDPVLIWTTHETLRLLVIALVPLTAAVVVAGMLGGFIQGVTRIHDISVGYTLRFAAAIVVTIITYQVAANSLGEIITGVLQRGAIVAQQSSRPSPTNQNR